MSNDDLNKSLNEAMGNVPEQELPPATSADPAVNARAQSKAKANLRTPPLVAEKVSEPVRESEAELRMRIKLEVLQELLAEQVKVKREGKAIHAAAVEEAEPEELVNFTVNLPVQATNIRIDGREYYHGHTYKIRVSQLDTFRDIQSLAWRHDDQVRGYRPHPGGARTNGVHINREGQVMTSPV